MDVTIGCHPDSMLTGVYLKLKPQPYLMIEVDWLGLGKCSSASFPSLQNEIKLPTGRQNVHMMVYLMKNEFFSQFGFHLNIPFHIV